MTLFALGFLVGVISTCAYLLVILGTGFPE